MSRDGAGDCESLGGLGTAAFMDMVRQHDRELRMLAYRLLGDRTDMDDALQDAYVKAFRGLGAFRGEAQMRTWLYRVVFNTCLDRLRDRRRRREVPLDAAVDEAGRGDDGLDPARLVMRRDDLAGALASLPEDQRAAVLLVDAAGFSYEEAGEILDVRPGTIGSRLNHARSILRTALAGEEG